MPATYTTSLRLTKPADGDINWGQTVNTGITDLVDASVAGTTTITMTAADYTLSNTNGTTDEARRMFIVATGSPGAPRNVICPAVSKLYLFRNDTAFTLTLKTSAGSGVAVPAGQYMMLYCDGTNVVDAVNAFGSLTTGALTASSLSLATALVATSGGTGQSVYAVGDLLYASTTTALSKLADVATGSALISGGVGVAPSWGKIGLTTHVSGTLPIASGGTGQTSIAARSIFLANTANTLTTVTPAALQSIRINAGNTAWEAFTPATGDASLSANNAFTGANTFYNATGQTFGTATSTQDGIVIQGRAGGTLSRRVTLSPGTLTASRSVTFPDAAGEIVLDAATQTLTNKTLTSPTLTTPALGTPASGVLTNCTGTASGLTAGSATNALGIKTATTTVSVSSATAPSSGQALIATSATAATWQTIQTTLNNVTAATGSATAANGNNPIAWNWTQTTASQTAFKFGETAAATNGVGAQYLLSVETLSNSTANPFRVQARGADVFNVSRFGALTLTSPSSTGATEPIVVATGDVSGTGDSGSLTIETGTAAANLSGNVLIASGATVSNPSGNITLQTGATTNNASGAVSILTGNGNSVGNISLTTGNATAGLSGGISLTTGTGVTGTGDINISTANATTLNSNAGDISITTGLKSASTGGSSGTLKLYTGNASVSGATAGNIEIIAGNLVSGGGAVLIRAGASLTTAQAGALVSITGGAGYTVSTGSAGGEVTVTGGAGGVGQTGGAVTITGGAGGATGGGGAVTIQAGARGSTGVGANVNITASNGSSGAGGDINLTTGTGSVNGKINFVNTNVANGTVATTLGSLGPTGASTTVQGWLAIKIGGTDRYIPFW